VNSDRAYPDGDRSAGSDRPGVLLDIQRIRDDRGVRLRLAGELDLSSAPELGRQLAELERADCGRVLIDLSQLEFIDSTGLTLIIEARRAAQENGRDLHLCAGPPQVQRLFELTGVLEHFTFED
jgi:anti-sigma B factor antagonist